MSFKKLAQFIRTKVSVFVTKNVSIEDQYTQAADQVITEITKLEKVFVKSEKEEARLRKIASEKEIEAIRKDDEIRRLITKNIPVDTHAKLAILYRRTGLALINKADELVKMRDEIKHAVVSLDNQRQDLAVKLEYIRETRNAESLGISCADDVVELAALTKIDVNDVMMRIETFNGDKRTEVTSSEVEDYINSLK
ncbi:e.6 hypothetical protein [Aeromonas phage 31]|uniref:Uncharacterized protein n=4 Tax=Biquartavirus TaxID=1912143 RepID=Q6U9P6_9CAUD|nr:e.6 [Aeromonas phage 44RR2.8t]YP_238784.1 e.6 hypothetical protein [Aeromonas phage 31]APU00529.1 hypothetical protein [Aeromonas phage 44RR2.8t.2]APU00950.1 hypothetical protein [Aeromonas phage 31.2]APU01861.1 hypothetical protein [Aeromonas phage L9-6]APU02111.1 hypothetical protein [Aeromonas phage Riv-10]APU02358.1 hypothetical protein [Aeromonas phage SW69-9]UYD59619.1 hypothetical protein JNMOADIG_00090 [Aeromonas phage avDM5]UYD60407.1 hypothetical protein NPHMPGLK_00072 [Aeromon